MTQLNGEQLEAACELVDERRRRSGAPTEEIVANLYPGVADHKAQILDAWIKWKRNQRAEEDHQDPGGDAGDVIAEVQPDHSECPVQRAVGALLGYLGQSIVKSRHVLRRSQVLLRAGEAATGMTGPGKIDLPDGTRYEWIASAVIVMAGQDPIKVLPECRLLCVTNRADGRRHVQFSRIVLAGSEANLKGIASSFGALMFLYRAPGHVDGVRRLAAALGIVTAGNISHHARRLARTARVKAQMNGHAKLPEFPGVKM